VLRFGSEAEQSAGCLITLTSSS